MHNITLKCREALQEKNFGDLRIFKFEAFQGSSTMYMKFRIKDQLNEFKTTKRLLIHDLRF